MQNEHNPPDGFAATLPFKEGEAKVCTFGAIITSSLRDTPSNRGNYLIGELPFRAGKQNAKLRRITFQ